MEIQVGDRFIAIVKKGKHSKTLTGKERAGRIIGPFIATAAGTKIVETNTRILKSEYFFFKKCQKNAKNE